MTNLHDNHMTSPTRLSRRVLALGIVCIIGITSLIAIVPSLFNTGEFTARLLADMRQLTGSRVKANGPLKLSLFPNFTATLSDVVTVDENSPIGINAGVIEIGFSPWHVMLGRFEISSIRLVNAEIVIRNPLPQALALSSKLESFSSAFTSAGKQMLSGAVASPFANKRLGLLSLVDSKITFAYAQDKIEYLSKVNATIKWPHAEKAAAIAGFASWRGTEINLAAGISEPQNFVSGTNSDVTLDVVSEKLALSFIGKSKIAKTVHASGSLSLNIPSMARFLQWSDAGIATGEGVGEVDIDAKLTTQNGKLLFDDMAMRVAGTSASGALEIDPMASPIKTSGTLAFRTVDLAAIGAALPIGLTTPHGDDHQQLKALNLDLRLSAELANIRGYSIQGAAGAIRIANGDASLDLGTGAFAGGTLHGRLDISGDAMPRTAKLSIDLVGARQDQLENLPQSMPLFDGPLSGKLEMSGSYSSLASLLATGDGALSIDFPSGVIRNFNVESMRLAMDREGIFELPTVYAGMSEAREVRLVGLIKNGVVLVTSAKANIAGQSVSITGAIPLSSGSLALQGSFTDAEPSATTKLAPFFIGGTIREPLVTAITP